MTRGIFRTLFATLLLLAAVHPLCAKPAPRAIAGFNAYTSKVESRLARQHQSRDAFHAPSAKDSIDETARLKGGELIVERLTPSAEAEISGSLLHHWRGTAFVPGAKAADFERLMQDFPTYPQRFSPQVLQARLVARNGDRLQASMRIRQKHVITVVLDTAYDITYGRLDAQHGYSISRSTQVSEIYAPGTPQERTLSPDQEQGFLWRLNTYWSYEEKDGGLYLQIEAVSLTRSIPFGLGWAIRPYIESIPRESLEFTLRSAFKALEPPAMSAAIQRVEK
jgi:hypothetical protein